MDVERGRQQLADGRPPAGFVDGLGTPGPEEEIIGQPARVCVAAEEGADVASETDWKRRDWRTWRNRRRVAIHGPSLIPASGAV